MPLLQAEPSVLTQGVAPSPSSSWAERPHLCLSGALPAAWTQDSPRPLTHRKAVKATLVLLPLLGITYMLFFVNPGEDDLSQIVFIYFNSFLQSFQVGTPAAGSPPDLDAQRQGLAPGASLDLSPGLAHHPHLRAQTSQHFL